jgi:glycerol-3-phosphate dehydrogenase
VKKMTQGILHYPNLKTVLVVEKTLQEADTVISKSELKRRLPTQIMHQTLNLILEYLEKSGKIIIGSKGITWIYNNNPKLKSLLSKAVRVA